ncbi:hypothetical protein [Burkholderia sp. MSMB1498]|uniref:hypothetical protein n=1 Tax=Burkholderia sp. MSMB1498 TaxID=1637842 RepID=UPI00075B379F|nr:hypothetical protein [Burkholderia sp. MSMB1498]KVK73678.1 hypothetical protein WS91_20285 [Burkholderia sp. MSMB1498]
MVRPSVEAALEQTLLLAVPAMTAMFRDPWCVIGSAALALYGVDVAPKDIDVLTSVRDADAAIAHWAASRRAEFRPADGARFRSRFARFGFAPLDVEVMGRLEVNDGRAWREVVVDSMRYVAVANVEVPVPSPLALERMLTLFGRRKDLERAALLRLRFDALRE